MEHDNLNYPYSSRRTTTFGKNGMVSTSQPLAAQAGLEILKKGGNAVDAAVATAACLTVVEPTSNGIGGDAFAIVWHKDELHGLNASGFSPEGISIEAVKERGVEKMPKAGFLPVTVPGAPSAWAALNKKFGKLSLTEVLEPAIRHAEEGYPISPALGYFWKRAYEKYTEMLDGEEFENWFKTFAPEGRPPEIGEIWSSKEHAETLRSIAESGAESFYRGDLAEKIDAFSRKYDGFIRKEDLAAYYPEWVDPINVNYRGYDIWEIPPNGQGLVALMALNIIKGFEFEAKDTIDTYHKQLEALKLAFIDGKKYITDPEKMGVTVEELLSEEYAEERRKLIKNKALMPEPGTPPKGGTVYLAAADGEGNMISYIQSNYMGFGSGLVVPGTGIALQNRGHSFSLKEEDYNSLEPRKRPYHTIIPGFITKDDQAVGPFGVMGGYMQPQGHLQVAMNLIDFNLNPQAALDAPRWQWMKDKDIMVEDDFPNNIAQALARKGHDIKVALNKGSFGRGQVIIRNPENGVLSGGTEKRTDGHIAVW
ncbi:MAG: gamma-glutamyltransferase [Bacillota bacterium]